MSSKEENKNYLFGFRLREETKRLGLNQATAGRACGVSREMWGKYERGESMPGGEVLFTFAQLGANLHYIATGSNQISERLADYSLTPEKEKLLENYEHCSEDDQRTIQRMALLAAKDAEAELSERKKYQVKDWSWQENQNHPK